MTQHRLREYRQQYPVLRREDEGTTFGHLLRFGAILVTLYLGILGIDSLLH